MSPDDEANPTTAGDVMVVDDNPANLKLMEEMLRPCGYQIRSFPRGRMALASAAQRPPDLFLLDINMPEMSGYEACEQLKSDEQLAQIPVIFLSALNTLEDRLRSFHYGGVDYITKPFQFQEVRARVGAHVRLRRFQNRLEDDNRRLEELVRIQVNRIAEGHAATIFAVARLAEARDHQTGKHLGQIQRFCYLLAGAMSRAGARPDTIDQEWIDNISQASPLHDIGKVAIPDGILQKPGKLTAEEIAVMQTHTTLGAETLRAVHGRFPDNKLIRMGIELALCHHERWDGTGYPAGLRGEEIPLSARILAVADCYEALRSKRSYKPSIPHEEACAIILGAAGTHFDPQVVVVFAELAETFREVHEKNGHRHTAVTGGF
jgi:putative two-component system response regulator